MTENNFFDILKVKNEISQFGIDEIHKLLFYMPIKYADYTTTVLRLADNLGCDEHVFFKAKVTKQPKFTYPSGANRVGRATIYATDGYDNFIITIFGNINDWVHLKQGQYFYSTGKVETWNQMITVKSAQFVPNHKAGKVVPQYTARTVTYEGKKYKVSSDQIHYYMGELIAKYNQKAVLDLCNYLGMIESEILRRVPKKIACVSDIFNLIHFPSSSEDIEVVNTSIIIMHAFKIINDASNSREVFPSAQSIINLDIEYMKELLTYPKFQLSIEQKQSVWEIMKQLASPIPCDHLLSGDVGCGKTIVYSLIAAAAQKAGKHVAIMIPNLPLAVQVKNEISDTFPFVNVEFISKGSKYNVPQGENPILIGTSALMHWLKKKKDFKLDLFIVDEQQKTGSSQKDIFLHDSLNVIEATATALPRTLMLAMLGMKSISKIEEPPVEKKIYSKISYSDEKREIFNKVNQIIDEGNQVCFLYPLKERSNEISLNIVSLGLNWDVICKFDDLSIFKKLELVFENKNDTVTIAKMQKEIKSTRHLSIVNIILKRDDVVVSRLIEFLLSRGFQSKIIDNIGDVQTAYDVWKERYPDDVLMLHGGLSDDDKVSAIAQAKEGKKKIIIASSIIEVGVTIPNLKMLVVVDPQLLGISTLHQIRGRLSRLGGEGWFVMLLQGIKADYDEKVLSRLNAIEKFKRGSELAEQDLLQRGFGDLSNVGVSQSGNLESIFSGIKLIPEDIFNYLKGLNNKG